MPIARSSTLSRSLVALALALYAATGAGACSSNGGIFAGTSLDDCASCINHTDTSTHCEGNVIVSVTIYDDCPESCAAVSRGTDCGAQNEVCVDVGSDGNGILRAICRPRCSTKADCPTEAPHCNHFAGTLVCGAHECFSNDDCTGRDAYCNVENFCDVALHAGDPCGPSGSPAPCAYPLHCLTVSGGAASFACR